LLREAELAPVPRERVQPLLAREHQRGGRGVECPRGRRVAAGETSPPRSRIERDPAPALEPRLDPFVSIVVGDDPLAGALVELAAAEARGDPRGDPEI